MGVMAVLGPAIGLLQTGAQVATAGAALAAGAITTSGSLLNTAVRASSLTYEIGSDIVGSASGLAKGVGSALGTTSEDRPEKDTTGSDEQGAKALPPGVKLNKNGVMVQDKGAKGGGQVLPGQFDESGNLMSLEDRLGSMQAPDRSDAGPLQQILDYVKVIAANTARTAAGVGNMSTAMQGMNAQSNIDDEKPPEGTKPQGAFGKMFSGVGKTIKDIGSQLGKTGKFLIKGLALGGLLYLFVDKQDEITQAVAGIFKYFHQLYLRLKDSDDPIRDLMTEIRERVSKMTKGVGDTMKTMFSDFKNSALKTLGPMTEDFIGWLWNKLKMFINDTIGFKLFDTEEAGEVRRNAKALTSIGDTFTAIKTDTGLDDLGTFKGLSMGKVVTEGEGVIGTRNKTNAVVLERLKKMREITNESGGRIQWTGLGFRMGGDINIAMTAAGIKELPISAIMSSQPILDNQMLTVSELQDKDFSLLKSAGVTKESNPENMDAIMANLAKVARYQRFINEGKISGDDAGKTGPLVFGEFNYQEKIDELLLENKNKYLANPKLISEFYEKDLLPDKTLVEEGAEAMKLGGKIGSFYTHDTHLEKLLEPVAEAFSKGANAPIIMDNSSNTSSVTKQGDTVQMPLGIHTTDPTARAFHEWKYA